MVPVHADALAFALVESTIELAEGFVLIIHIEHSHHTELRSAIDSVRTELGRLRDACDAQNGRGAASCMDEPSPAVAIAGHALGRSLDEMGHVFAVKRRIMPPEDPDKRPKQCIPRPVCPHRGGDYSVPHREVDTFRA
jgi:hypothetical protein